MSLISKVLIANRGAIATRIIRTLDRMNIQSVAVYAESDRESLHVQRATEACSLGEGAASNTYLDIDKLLALARQTGCQAIHPGYGFLSENTEFVTRCEAAGIIFIGPTAKQIAFFGQKHIARELAADAGVPLPPGSPLLSDLADAVQHAQSIGYPVMLKSTAGGGGIGMQLCQDQSVLADAFNSVKRLGSSYFSNDGVFLEKAISRARHIEVQVFGDGKGAAISLGERDCSAQRRNQKVVEECPAPKLSDTLREQLYSTAEKLLQSVDYRNAGTVEFIVDADSEAFYFLEVNTRLQVEHGVTEEVYGFDLVEWMVLQASNELAPLSDLRQALSPVGHAIQVRLYAEDPYRDFQPCAGPLTHVEFPHGDGIRVDSWVESGITIPSEFDPMLAKLIVHAPTRAQALLKLQNALRNVTLYGSVTNASYLAALSHDKTLAQALITTRYLDTFEYTPARMEVLRGGTQSTIQDLPGRVGYWPVGIPPSGPFDSLSFELANRLLANDPGEAGLEITLQGPALRFSVDCHVAVTGGDVEVTIDGDPVEQWRILFLKAGQVLDIGSLKSCGARAYLCVAGGIQCPGYLGSRSTFTLGRFGGHNGEPLKAGDVLALSGSGACLDVLPEQPWLLPTQRPELTNTWVLRVVYGPHGAPDFFTDKDIRVFFSTVWQVHYNSSRTGVRLIGPSPEWARTDGGEAGLHPSNIHDTAYAFGSVDFTGDMPVILGPDGPSLGGFVCPATVITADLWKIGQLRANDTVQFVAVSIDQAVALDRLQREAVASLDTQCTGYLVREIASSTNVAGAGLTVDISTPIVKQRDGHTQAVYRTAGDRFLLVEYGETALNLVSRFRVHALMQWLEENPLDGVIELTPGIRSLQVHYDSQSLHLPALLEHMLQAELHLDENADSVSVPSRVVHLPLSWDDEACRLAIEKYDQSVRRNAPWYPSNLEFIRRINGLDSLEDVKRIVFDASYLVMGLGDVYLGAPVATPVNPAHRLVTTKYNPARTWTAENSVGIGGSYLCVYGMEGPGGYQFIGRTLQMWNRYKQTKEFDKPWLLRFFDQIRFFEVTHDELNQIRRDFPHGRYPLKIEHTSFSLHDFHSLVSEQQNAIQVFQTQRETAFADELAQWRATGQFTISTEEAEPLDVEAVWPEGSVVVESPVSGSLWKSCVSVGDRVVGDQTLLIIESMKMEIAVSSPGAFIVRQVLTESGQRVNAGQPLIILENP